MTHTTAIVPMRHNSERVPGKNYRPLGDAPLYHHIVRTLLEVPEIDEVVIDTDSPLIIEDAMAAFPRVRIVERPEHLRDGAIPMNDVLLNTIRGIEADVVVQTHSTNPFLRADSLSRALREFEARGAEFDSMFSVTRMHTRFWTHDGQPMNHDPAVLLRTQDLPPVFLENSCFYIFTPDVLSSVGNRLGRSPRMFEVEPLEAVDIDDESDFAVATALMEARSR